MIRAASHAAGRYWDEVAQYKAGADEIERDMERLLNLIGPTTPIVDIDDEMIARIVTKRRAIPHQRSGKPVSAATVNRQVVKLLRPILIRAKKKWKISLPNEPEWSDHLLREPKERVRELKPSEES